MELLCVARRRASWYTAASFCVAPLSLALSMLRERLGRDNPTTIPMIDTTTSNSVRVNPACEAHISPRLAVDLNLLPLPRSAVRLKLTWASNARFHRLAVG